MTDAMPADRPEPNHVRLRRLMGAPAERESATLASSRPATGHTGIREPRP